MGSAPTKPAPPEKTLKEQVDEYKKEITGIRREFSKECMKLEIEDKRMGRQLKKMIENREPESSRKVLAQNILKNQKFIGKYKGLDAQLQNTTFELQSMVTMNQMENVVAGMAKIMGSARTKMNVPKFTAAMKTYTTEKEKMELLNEMIQDTMDVDEEINDTEVDQLISNYEDQIRKKKMNEQMEMDEDAM